jgi:glutamate dehydrogenase
LPDDETLVERHALEQGLTRPEIAVLLAYSKLFLYQELLESDLPDDALLVEDLVRYFPRPLQERHRDRIANHRLRREIIATYTTNSMINRVGPTFITRLGEATGSSAVDIARAYTVARDIYHLRDVWAQIEALDDKLVAELQMDMVLAVGRLLERTTLWFLRHSGGKAIDITATVRRYEAGVVELSEDLAAILPAEHIKLLEAEARTLQAKGAPQELARRIASLPLLSSACDIVRIAGEDQDVREVARIYFRLGARLGIDWLRETSRKLRTKNRWQKDALEGIIEDFYSHQSLLTSQVLEAGQGQARPVRSWMQRNRQSIARLRHLVEELRAVNVVDISMLTVANQQLRALTLR